ncbi:MAG: polyprenyl synthetase family protein [Puia sp.]|nr:polyprenyl synthetase family protein [Puia sp.]
MQLTRDITGPELSRFGEDFKDIVKSHTPLPDRIMDYMILRKGKQMRPMFVLLAVSLGGTINDSSHRAALFAEMLHTSSLIHDDLLDDSPERRGASPTFEKEEPGRKMYLFGGKPGIAFQLKDDLLDYGNNDIGKPTGNDIEEKKTTLPVIYTINTCPVPIAKKILNTVKHHGMDRAY